MRKVIVIGSPGAGKSTFARRLRDMTGLPLFYLDMIWHKQDGNNVPAEEFDQKLPEIYRLLEKYKKGREVHVCRSRSEIGDFFK